MQVEYPSFVVNNQTVKLLEVQKEPHIYLTTFTPGFYSIVMYDIDVKIGSNTTEFAHAWIANIDLSNNYSESWIEYYPPTPPKYSGKHRYIFALYKQPRYFPKPTEFNNVQFRVPFNLQKWVKYFQLQLVDKKMFIIDA